MEDEGDGGDEEDAVLRSSFVEDLSLRPFDDADKEEEEDDDDDEALLGCLFPIFLLDDAQYFLSPIVPTTSTDQG